MENNPELQQRIINEYWLNAFTGIRPINASRQEGGCPPRRLYTTTLGPEITAKVRQVTNGNLLAEYALYLSAYAVLLNKYFCPGPLVIASHDIEFPEAESKSSTLYYRVEFAPGTTLREAIRGMQGQVKAAIKHRHYDFNDVARQFERRQIRQEVAQQVSFGFSPFNATSDKIGQEVIHLQIDRKGDHALEVSLNCCGSVTARHPAVRMADHFKNILGAMPEHYDTPLHQVPYLTEEEKALLLLDLQGEQVATPDAAGLIARFERQAAATPDAPAVVAEQELTYRDLNEKANKIAFYLRQVVKLEPGDAVALMCHRESTTVAAILGILKAGGAYVPIDPAYPRDRVDFILDDIRPKALITQSADLLDLQTFGGKLLILDIQLDGLPVPEGNPGLVNEPDGLAYVCYTSGSTGQPKGVMMARDGVVSLVDALAHAVYNHHGPHPLRIALVAPFVFDPSVQQLFYALLHGHTLVIVPDAVKQDGAQLWRFFSAERVDVADGTPSHLALMAAGRPDAAVRQPSHFLIGGETLPAELVRKLFELYPAGASCAVTNLYGLTECGVDTTSYTVHAGNSLGQPGALPIGKALPNRRVYILNEAGELLPPGFTGEMYVGGEGVFSGYWQRADRTAEKLVADPFAPAPARLCKTGDLVRWHPDGNLEFLGRNDNQIKIRGYRVELEEIEQVLLTHPGVKAAAVIAREDKQGEKRLAAYYATESGLKPAEAKAYLAGKLPAYMVPPHVAPLKHLPLTVNGKTDRKALALLGDRNPEGKPTLLPRSVMEVQLARIWQEVLEVDQVGVDDNFFDIGGSSLKIVTLIPKLAVVSQVKLTVPDLFKYNTIESLSRHLAGESEPAALKSFEV